MTDWLCFVDHTQVAFSLTNKQLGEAHGQKTSKIILKKNAKAVFTYTKHQNVKTRLVGEREQI